MDGAKGWQDFALDRYDTYGWYLRLGPLATVNERFFRGNVPTWNGYATHPDYDAFWQKQTMIPHIRTVTVPTLNVAGWWDQEDFSGPVRIYETLEPSTPGTSTTSWSDRGTIAAGHEVRASASARLRSAAPPLRTSGTRCRRPGSPTT